MSETANLRWFEAFPKCARCGKVAHGILRGAQNQSYGYHCTRCANKRLKDSDKVRADEARKREFDAIGVPQP